MGLAMLCVFCAGLVVGGATAILIVQKHIAARMDHTQWSPRTIAWLAKELSLTTEQQSRIKPPVDSMATQLKQLQDDTDAERKALFGRMLMEIHGELTDEQAAKLKEVLQKAAAKKNGLQALAPH